MPVGTTIIIDDGASGRFPDPDLYVDQAAVIRVGQTLQDVEGIMAEGYNAYRYRTLLTTYSAADETTNAMKRRVEQYNTIECAVVQCGSVA